MARFPASGLWVPHNTLSASMYSLTSDLLIDASDFGGMSVEATIPVSVTVVMSQFEGLTSSSAVRLTWCDCCFRIGGG